MTTVEIVMPAMGESVMEGTVLQWLKQEGDAIEQEEPLLEVATDKVDTEVPATHSGILQKILAAEGTVVEVGKPIAIIAQQGSDTDGTSDSEATEVEQPVEEIAAEALRAVAPPQSKTQTGDSQTEEVRTPELAKTELALPSDAPARFYSPLVMSIAREEGLSEAQLAQIPGTGKEGRLTKKDLLSYLKTDPGSRASEERLAFVEKAPSLSPAPAATAQSGDEVIEMDRMRKMIATRMVASKQTSAHVTSFVEADVTGLVHWRNRMKDTFQEREGEKLTFMPLFVEAIAKAIKDFPMINVSVDGNSIIRHKDVNIGMAVALPSGNLIVPVIAQADRLSLTGLAKQINSLSDRARSNRLTADDLARGTYTVSNIGSFGNLLGTPIIMQPQVAILALGAIVKKPSVVETPSGDAIAVRHRMYLSHSYDHRVVDGALGGMFVKRVADYLEKFDADRDL
jgi:2-oxoglutarate dehydrogenase E2 component (dihydrolipoamide succinyltransferase)